MKRFFETQRFLDDCMKHYAAMTLANDAKRKTAKVIEWRGLTWVCTGGMLQYLKYQTVDLCECVPVERYTGPMENPESPFYMGVHFFERQREWVLTGNEVQLYILDVKARNLYRKAR